MEGDSDDDKNNKINNTNKNIDVNYKVDLKNPKYIQNFQRIQIIFEDNYINFIKNIKDQEIKEIYILMRKYQHFFTKMKLNEILIFDFSKSSDILLNNIKNYFNDKSENSFTFEISILPKFKKSEIEIPIPGDTLNCSFTIYFSTKGENNQINFLDKSNVEITNFSSTMESKLYKITTQLMSTVLNSSIEDYKDNIIQGFNKFITYIENYFPEIIKKALENYNKLLKQEWLQEEQDRLEEALLKFKDEKNLKEKFKKVSEYVKTKSVAECVKRYKKLKSLAKNISNDSNSGSEEEKEVKKNISDISNINNENNEKSEVININSVPKKENIIKNISEATPITPMPNNTLDLVDEILNQFNSLYTDMKFDTPTPDDENVYNEDSEDFGEFDEYDDDDEYNDIDIDNEKVNNIIPTTKKGKNLNNNNNNINTEIEKSLKINIPSDNQKQITTENYTLLNNVVHFGDKNAVVLSGVLTRNIAIAEICEVKLLLKCNSCKAIGFESNFMKLNPKVNIFYCGAICPKCKNEMHAVFKSEMLHQENTRTAGIIFSTGIMVVDLLSSSYIINCVDCQNNFKKIKIRTGVIQAKEKTCTSCQNEFTFHIGSVGISITNTSNYSFFEELKIQHFTKFNTQIQDFSSSNYIKKYDRVGEVGNALPENGICKHYKQSFRWFRFECCGKAYPCDLCHDEISGHKYELAKNCLCGYCAFEQPVANNMCAKCGRNLKKEEAGKGFWEGGKGTRDKALMSNKDNHKFKNSGMKTISNKKKEKMMEKK
jgi:hypothetical protein